MLKKKKWYVTTELILEKKSECFKKKQKKSKATIYKETISPHDSPESKPEEVEFFLGLPETIPLGPSWDNSSGTL